ncbi:MAG: MOSC domain-containing protein [Planctomycetes bacterium]|nr:MOSC domain-containing protein [Planctomycetota bacterium]
MAKIVGVCISDRKGIPKKNIGSAYLEKGLGIKDDAHSGKWHRQISLLANEAIDTMRQKGYELVEGSFAENLTTEGIDLKNLPIGTELRVGESVRLKITQIGKECHTKCAIFRKVGDCIMPLEGVFAEVVESGTVKVGDTIKVV